MRVYSSLTRKLRQVFHQLRAKLVDNALGTVCVPTSSKPKSDVISETITEYEE
jgi:hypothetical protein